MSYSEKAQRRPWSAQQDSKLSQLCQKLKINKWSLIAKIMEEQYNFTGRTGKQCRQRYNNHLNPLVCRENWSDQENQKLCRLHDQLGNKWALIAAQLKGRTDNAVKNQFFAKLRKAIRKINKTIQQKFKRRLKPIRLNVLYKIIQANQEQFKKTPNCSIEISKYSCQLKKNILAFSDERSQYPGDQEFVQMVEKVLNFAKDYKRKPKQFRRVPSQNVLPAYEVQQEDQNDQEDGQDENQIEDHSSDVVNISQVPAIDQKAITTKPSFKTIASKSNQQDIKQQQKNPQKFLQARGMLEQDEDELSSLPALIKHGSSSSLMFPRCAQQSSGNNFVEYSINNESHNFNLLDQFSL